MDDLKHIRLLSVLPVNLILTILYRKGQVKPSSVISIKRELLQDAARHMSSSPFFIFWIVFKL